MKYMNEDGEIVDTICEDCAPVWKTPNNHDTHKEAELTATRDFEKSLTDQSFKEDTDINVITERLRAGMHVDIPLPEHFGEGDRLSYLEIQEHIAENNRTFYNLDPRIREEFLNNPARWADQVNRDLKAGNVENLQRMGIDIHAKAPTAPPVTPAPAEPPVGGGGPVSPPEPPKKD